MGWLVVRLHAHVAHGGDDGGGHDDGDDEQSSIFCCLVVTGLVSCGHQISLLHLFRPPRAAGDSSFLRDQI